MRNYTPIKNDSGDGDYAEYLLEKEASKQSADYYVEGQTNTIASVYIGSKSKALGLEGEISLEAGQALLDGYLPDGTQIRQKKSSEKEILGHDNTFSAPKSASIQCASDMRVFDAHVDAVQSAIVALEEYCCYQRVQVDGHRQYERGDGFVGWMTHHWQSREGDIDLHTHVVTANGCEGPDGQWRSIHDTLMSESRWLGNYYRNCYAKNLQEIGYEVREKKLPKDGYSFEIVGYSDEQVDDFSTRHQQIAKARSQGMSDQAAWYTTRKAKDEELSVGELFEQTLAQKEAIGVIGHEPPSTRNKTPIGKTDAKAAVDLAIAHLSRSQCKFTESDLLAQVFTHMEQFGLEEVEAAIASHTALVDYGVIHSIELKGTFTTAQSLQRETDIINRWMDGQGKATPIMDIDTSKNAIQRMEALYKSEWESSHETKVSELRAKVEKGDTSKRTAKKLEKAENEVFKYLNKGQLGAIQGALATENQHFVIYGLSGVGKTRSLKPLKTILDEEKVKSVWLAPSIGAAAVLSEDIGKQAFTAQRLAYTNSIKLKRGMLIGIDEAGLIDAECMDIIGRKAEEAGARIFLIGDPKQNKPVQAGSPMTSLIYNGAETFNIDEILRQQDPIQKKAVELIARGDGVASIQLLNEHGYVSEIEDARERQRAIAFQYLRLDKEERTDTLVIAGTNEERLALTKAIRDGLKDVGSLGDSLDCVQLVDARLSPEQQTDVRNYEIGQYLDPLQNYSKARRHEFCKIVGKTETHLIMQNPRGLEFELKPDRWDKRVYNETTINVAVNDEIRFKGGVHGANYRNGQIFKVTEIEGTIATIENAKGKTRTLDLSKPLPIDHNIVRTTYDAQGSGKDRAILSLTSDRTSNQGSTYVGISRQFNHLSVYTQDYDALLRRVAQECTHSNALDLLEINYGHSTSRNNDSRDGSLAGVAEYRKEFTRRRGDSDESHDERERGGIQTANDSRSVEQYGGTGSRSGETESDRNTGISSSNSRDEQGTEGSAREARSIDSAIQSLTENYLWTERSKTLIPSLHQLGNTLDSLREVESELGKAQEELNDAIAQRTALQSANAEKMAVLTGDRPTYKVVSQALTEWRELQKDQPDLKAETVLGRALMERKNDLRIESVAKFRRWPEFVREAPDKPKKVQAFWVPDYSDAVKPEHINLSHWIEMQKSAIHPSITAENVRSLDGETALRYLLEAKMGTLKGESDQYATDPVKYLLNRYQNMTEGGWWAGSEDWGSFKPDKPRLTVKTPLITYKWQGEIADEVKQVRANTESMAIALLMKSGINPNKFMDFKAIKYEHPPGANRGLFMPRVPDELAQRIYAKYDIAPTKDDFWQVIKDHPEIPIVLNEGYKKPAATLSQGFVAIGAPGINGFYRANDENGRSLILRELHPDLIPFAVPGREFIIALDEDEKTSTIWDVRRDTVRTAELLEEYGSTCKVAHWEGAKGNDDLIVQQGPEAYIKALNNAGPAEVEKKIWYRAEYNKITAQILRDDLTKNAPTLEVEAFLAARNKGDAKDCDRFMSASDNIRKLDNPSEYLAELRAIAVYGKEDTRLIAQPDEVQESLLWLNLIIAKYGTEDKDLVLGDWVFSRNGGCITAVRDGAIGLEARNGLIFRFEPELRGCLRDAIMAMQSEVQRENGHSY